MVGDMPRILRGIIEGAVALEPDMTLVREDGDLSALVRRSDVDVAIVAHQSRHGDAAHRQALIENPSLKMVVVTENGAAGHVLEFQSRAVVDLSPPALVRAIRAAVGGGPGSSDVT